MSGLAVPLLATILFITYITLDAVLNDWIWDLNTEFTKKLQENESTTLTIVFDFFTYIVFVPPVIVFIAFIVMDCKLNALIYMAAVIASVTANELLKNIYHQPRPYMVESEIKGIACNPDYGKPSGHAQNSVVLVYLMPLLIFPQLYRFRQQMPSLTQETPDARSKTGYTIDSFDGWQGTFSEHQSEGSPTQNTKFIKFIKVIIITLLTCSLFMTGLSRVYLGVHSIGQVMLGWVYAAYFLVLFICVIGRPLRHHCYQIFHAFNTKSDNYDFVVTVSILMLFFLTCVAILFLELNIYVFVSQSEIEDWVQKINQCNAANNNKNIVTEKTPSVLYNGTFQTTFAGALITGLIIGAFIIKGRYSEGHFYYYFSSQTARQICKRIFVFIGMFVILIPLIFIRTENVYIQAFCQILPGALIAGFLITAGFAYLCHKWDIQLKGDIFHQVNHQNQSHLQEGHKDSEQIQQ